MSLNLKSFRRKGCFSGEQSRFAEGKLLLIRHRPLLCGTLGFASGVGLWLGGLHSLPLIALIAVLGLALLAISNPACALAGFALAGAAVGALRAAACDAVSPSDLSRLADSPVPLAVTGTVVSDPDLRFGRLAFTLRADGVTRRGQKRPVTGLVSVAIPETHPAPDYGDRLVLEGTLETPPEAGNPGEFSWRAYLAQRGIYCLLHVRHPSAVRILGAGGSNPLLRFAWNTRHRLLQALAASLPSLKSAVLAGILIGWRAALPPALMDDFVRTGTVHILASAGLHVGIVAFWLLKLCEKLTLPRKSSALSIILILILYAAACGGRPSVTRAVIMAVVYFAATLVEREPDLPTTVAVAALIILFDRPSVLLESGFQLSFLTVLTLAVGMPVWNAFWRPRVEGRFARSIPRKSAVWALELAGLSLLAQIGSLPIVARDYNEVSFTGIAANLLVVPVLFALIPLGFAGALAWPVWHGLGAALLAPCGALLTWIVGCVQACAAPSWAVRSVPSPPSLWIVLYYVVIFGVLTAWRGRRPTSVAL